MLARIVFRHPRVCFILAPTQAGAAGRWPGFGSEWQVAILFRLFLCSTFLPGFGGVIECFI